MVNHLDVIVIGGGAAGLFCAIEAGKRGRKVIVLEHAERVGKKIGISGGGRCNFTNIHTTSENFVSANPYFCKSALARYTPTDFIALVQKHNIGFHEKKLGQLFCNEGSGRIIDMLLNECSDAGVEVLCRSTVRSIAKREQFEVELGDRTLLSQSLVLATGGLSIAPLGATDFGYRLARQFGLKIEETKPGLVPLTLTREVLQQLSPLSGVSVDASVRSNGKEFRENVLVTHRGLSGPAILQISSYWKPGLPIEIDLLPDQDALKLLREHETSETSLAKLLSQFLPKRFAQAWCELNFPSKPLNQYTPRQLSETATKLHHWSVIPSGTEGYKKAEVTSGGVSTDELSSKTMEARNVAGLYFIGEVVDVTGQLGGYNFQWAWASGFAAGQYV
ncbi:MAG TPA: NAD(P)/FAD-dependent oxidoreductase [Pyrinomonadaceae bacterium]|nr:NAD(P)/FAD-dependent oxidoreductase [Pyrinomonadaceae bacterium]